MKGIKLEDIDLIVYDFDGVMTDNKVLVSEDGKEAVFCNRADGLAVSKIKEMDISQIILSTEKNTVVDVRAQKLGIEAIYGSGDKKLSLTGYCEKKGYCLERVVYIGNDVNDLDVMKIAGYPLAPEDANNQVKDISVAIINKRGGEGVVREFLENILGV